MIGTRSHAAKDDAIASKKESLQAASEPVAPTVPSQSNEMQSKSPETQSVRGFDALSSTNLEEWKLAVPGLNYSDTFYKRLESWDMESTNRTSGVPILLSRSGQTVPFKVRSMDVMAVKTNGLIQTVHMHSPIMNIEETRELGMKLCGMLGIEPSQFQAWCDKVGNNWMDAPHFSSGGSRDLQKNRIYSFGVENTYNNEKPWYIDFVISQQ